MCYFLYFQSPSKLFWDRKTGPVPMYEPSAHDSVSFSLLPPPSTNYIWKTGTEHYTGAARPELEPPASRNGKRGICMLKLKRNTTSEHHSTIVHMCQPIWPSMATLANYARRVLRKLTETVVTTRGDNTVPYVG